MTSNTRRQADASEQSLLRIFTVPEDANSTLSIIEQKLSQDLAGFLGNSIAALEKPLSEIETDFKAFEIPAAPRFVSDYTDEIMQNLVAH